MGNDFIPSRDAELEAWLLNFKTLIVTTPTNYGLVAADGTAVGNTYGLWHSAYVAASTPSTRNHITIAAKDAQKILTVDVVRTYSEHHPRQHGRQRFAQAGPGGLMFTTPSQRRFPLPRPTPSLAINGAGPLIQELRAADQMTPTARAKPAGQCWAPHLPPPHPARPPPTHGDGAPFLGFVTKADIQSSFASADDGKIATYFARWTNAKGRRSEPVEDSPVSHAYDRGVGAIVKALPFPTPSFS